MTQEQWKARKVVIVGAGAVGSTFAYALAQSGLADEIALVDLNRELAEGQVLDLVHGMPFFPPVNISVGKKGDYADAQVIVIATGASQRPGESRLDLLHRNAAITEGIVDEIVGQGSQAVILVLSNPVDILTHVASKRSGWERGRVIGSGTVLDSARFRYLLSQHCGVDVHNVHAYVLGEHEKVVKAVKESAYHIIDYKGATYFAIGLALVRIVGAILRNQRSVLTVSTVLDGEYGLEDVCLSVPCVVSQQGVERIVEANLSPEESEALSRSASVLREAMATLSEGRGSEG